jgi:serine/threonine-protein kinase
MCGEEATEPTPVDESAESLREDARRTGDGTVTLTWHDTPESAVSAHDIPRQLGTIRLGDEIGRGGMGVVVEGWDELLHRSVAVKFLFGAVPDESDPEFGQFLTGARAEAAVRHPNIVQVHSAGLSSGFPYLVMDFIDGPTLRAVSRACGPLPLAAAAKVMLDVSGPVAALHEHGFVHRDIKPANVMFDRDGHLFVTDFGLASLRRRAPGGRPAAGTPGYMAPEAFSGKAGAQADVYAMGVMLYELLAGRSPFSGDLEALREQHCTAPLPLGVLEGRVPDCVVDVIERAAHKKEIFRYKTAEHFQRALRGVVASRQPLAEADRVVQTLVTRTLVGEPDVRPASPSGGTPSASYFDRLSEIAARKRGNVAGDSHALAAQVAPSDMITEDLRCVTCGYNLRALTLTQACPECGSPVARSTGGAALTYSDPAWLERIARGQTLIYAACALILGGIVVVIAGEGLIALSSGATARVIATLIAASRLGLLLAAALLLAVGVFDVTRLEPRQALTEQPLTLRRVVRCLAVAGVLTALTLETVPSALRGAGVSSVLIGACDRIGIWPYWVIGLATVWAGLHYLAGLADRFPTGERQSTAARLAARTRTRARRLALYATGWIGGRLAAAIVSALGGSGAALSFLTIVSQLFCIAVLISGLRVMVLMAEHRVALKRCVAEAQHGHKAETGAAALTAR